LQTGVALPPSSVGPRTLLVASPSDWGFDGVMKLAFALCLMIGCGGGQDAALKPGRPAPVEDDPVAAANGDGSGPVAAANSADGPHISRSVGVDGGAVVFWPRVIPKTSDATINALARDMQAKIVELTKKAVGEDKIDVRPEPERVCPKMGCAAMTVGVLLTHVGGGCTAVALVSGSGQAPQKLVPWAGKVAMAKTEVPFREYAESEITIRDAVPCKDLLAAMAARDIDVRGAIKAAKD
jgi:hypothetical protein